MALFINIRITFLKGQWLFLASNEEEAVKVFKMWEMKDKFVYYCLLLNHKGEILAKTGSPDPKHHEVVSSVVPPPCCPSDHGLNHPYPFSNGSRCCANNQDKDDKALNLYR